MANNDVLNIRSAPDADNSIVAEILPNGTDISVIGLGAKQGADIGGFQSTYAGNSELGQQRVP